ncbi:MAG: transmembrane domain-containing protein [Micrococcales bacterium]|nr:transmembrane domain-containing protein [Micrococcales bacterium]
MPFFARSPLRPLVLASALVTLLALGGCVRATADFTVTKDDTVSATITVAFSDQALDYIAEKSGQPIGQIKEQVQQQTASELALFDPKALTEAISDEGYTGSKLTMTDLNIKNLTGGPGGIDLQITHADKQFKLQGVVDLPTIEDFLGAGEALPGEDITGGEEATISVTFTFPGPVTAANGKANGNMVSWDIKLGEVTQISAVAKESGLPWAIIAISVGGGLALIVAVAFVLLLLRRRGQKKRAAKAAASDAIPVPSPPPPLADTPLPQDGPPPAGSDRFAPPSDKPPVEPPAALQQLIPDPKPPDPPPPDPKAAGSPAASADRFAPPPGKPAEPPPQP